jgi:hypothetical protein
VGAVASHKSLGRSAAVTRGPAWTRGAMSRTTRAYCAFGSYGGGSTWHARCTRGYTRDESLPLLSHWQLSRSAEPCTAGPFTAEPFTAEQLAAESSTVETCTAEQTIRSKGKPAVQTAAAARRASSRPSPPSSMASWETAARRADPSRTRCSRPERVTCHVRTRGGMSWDELG